MSWPPERAIPALYPGCPPDIATWAASRLRRQWTTPHAAVCPLTTWPDVPSSSILAREDSAVGTDWARHAAKDRLNTTVDEIDGGHSPFLSRPSQLADLLHQIASRT